MGALNHNHQNYHQTYVDHSRSSRLTSRKRLVTMTNSAPKMNNKVERQGSPNNGGKRQQHQQQHNRTTSIKTTTYFSSTGNAGGNNRNNTSKNTNGRMSCSPPCQMTKNTRNSPLRNSVELSPRGSPTGSFYAGAKFSEPPSPASLPKPPSHWTTRLLTSCQQSETCCNISNHLKMILNVQA